VKNPAALSAVHRPRSIGSSCRAGRAGRSGALQELSALQAFEYDEGMSEYDFNKNDLEVPYFQPKPSIGIQKKIASTSS